MEQLGSFFRVEQPVAGMLCCASSGRQLQATCFGLGLDPANAREDAGYPRETLRSPHLLGDQSQQLVYLRIGISWPCLREPVLKSRTLP
jgi:hypothetical protein